MDSKRGPMSFLHAMRRIYPCIALLALYGCAGSSRRASPGAPEDRDAAALSEALKAARAEQSRYTIAPDDVIEVAVYQDRNLNVRAHVDADGQVSVPLAGPVHVAGETVSQAQASIASQLSRYVVNPQVTITVDSRGSKQLYVLGEVQKPGAYPLSPTAQVTVLQAVTNAGGFTKMAAPKRAHVLRYLDGKSVDYKIDLKTLIRQGDREKDMVLQPNDVVYIPESLF